MIEDGIIVVFKLIACILRVLIEIGIDFGLRAPGKLLRKCIWPPNWFRPLPDQDGLDIFGSLLFYGLILYFISRYCCAY